MANLKYLVAPAVRWYVKCKISFLRCTKFELCVCLFIRYLLYLSVIFYLLLNKVCLPFFRFFFTSLNGGDVPIIYSPVPFQNSSLNFPEVRLMKVNFILI
jgi:hypothetical protein